MMEEFFRDKLDKAKAEKRQRKSRGFSIKPEIGRERNGALVLGKGDLEGETKV